MLWPFASVYALSDSIMKRDKQRQKAWHVKLLFEPSFYSEKIMMIFLKLSECTDLGKKQKFQRISEENESLSFTCVCECVCVVPREENKIWTIYWDDKYL